MSGFTSSGLSLGGSTPGQGHAGGAHEPNAAISAESAADPDTLMAASYGQGEFAINLAPLILNNAVTIAGRRRREAAPAGREPARLRSVVRAKSQPSATPPGSPSKT